MKTTFGILTAVALIGFGAQAYAADYNSDTQSKSNGGYESNSSSETVTPSGEERSSESTVDVNVDSKGRMEKTIKSQSTRDPKGLMNKRKNTSETQIEEKARGGYKQTTTRKAMDANGTNTTYKTVTNVDVDVDGNVTSTVTTDKVVDPKGLLNEKTTTTKTKSYNGREVERTKHSD